MAMTKEDVADAVRAWCQAWHTHDIETILAMEARAVGFGFRPWAWRDHVALGEGRSRQAMEQFFGQKEAYSLGDFLKRYYHTIPPQIILLLF